MVDLTPYSARIQAAANNYCADPRSAFLSYLRSYGINPKSLVIGRIDRVDGPEDKPNKKNAWYVYQEFNSDEGDTIGVGNFGCWKTGLNEVWCSRADNSLSPHDRAKFHESREKIRAQQKIEEIERQNDASSKALGIYQTTKQCGGHPYFDRKGILPINGVNIGDDGRLVIPVLIDEKISSLQMIDGAGNKRFLTGGKIKGGYFRIDGHGDAVYLAEGLATGASIHESTLATVYIAFNAGNLYEVANYVRAKEHGILIVAGDDDTNSPGNVGRTKAQQVADGLGVSVIFPPTGFNDFNDYHKAHGVDALREYLIPSRPVGAKKAQIKNEVETPPGILADIAGYYNATSGNNQPGFAVQTALAVGSIILGRNYRSSLNNYTSLFFVNVGKSGTGKEHTKTVIERVLSESGKGGLIAGDGYTSGGAVFSALLDRPKHIAVIDEFGRYLESGTNMAKGSQNQREANTKLMESIGRAHDVLRPPSYSSMTLKKEQADAIKNRVIYNPAITLMTMTTPSTLFKSLDMGAIKDGFVNRFLICISDTERAIRKHKQPIAVPERIIDWINKVDERHGKPSLAIEPAVPVVLDFDIRAIEAQEEFQQYCIDTANSLERFGMEELPGRSNEMAMRIAVICALARNPMATIIDESDMRWGINYVKALLDRTIAELKLTISGSEFESVKKEILADLRKRGADGITWPMMQKNAPYSRHKPKDLREIMMALKDAELAHEQSYVGPAGGRPTSLWVAV